MNHSAIIAKLENVRPHPNADRLQLANCKGYQIVVGLEQETDDVGVFFYPELQLSEEYCAANDLIRRRNPDTNEMEGGMFDKNRRVRSQNLRKEKSEGYWAPLESLDFASPPLMEIGFTFQEIGGVPICDKYVTQATKNAMNSNKQARRANKCFPKHVETEKLSFAIDDIQPGSIVYITEKIHGTSARYGYVIDETPLTNTFWDKVFRRPAKINKEYTYLAGTRNMVLGQSDKPSYYGKEEFRANVFESFKHLLVKGEVVYGEIVGYTTDGTPIMSNHSTKELKEIKKKYGPEMVYKYGNEVGQCHFYVYRIVHTNEDGDTIELSWPQVKARAKELGLDVVPKVELWDGLPMIWDIDHINSKEYLEHTVDKLVSGPSILDPSHIREGIVLRVEGIDGKTNFYKHKSFDFGVLEGYLKLDDTIVDMEEAS